MDGSDPTPNPTLPFDPKDIRFACTPDECVFDLNEYGDIDRIVTHCAALLDLLEPVRGEGDDTIDDAYATIRSTLYNLIDAYTCACACDPHGAVIQHGDDQPRVTCRHGMHDSWEAYAMHAIRQRPRS